MDQSLPDFIKIRRISNAEICATFYKNKKIVFTSPERLKDKTVHSMYEASYVIDNAADFPPARWEVIEPKGWDIWSYERRVNAYLQNLKKVEIQDSVNQEEASMDSDKKVNAVIDPRVCDNWTSEIVAEWICQDQKPELELIDIRYFRRYNHGLCFEFLCVWNMKDLNGNFRQTWQKYADLNKNINYGAQIRSGWDCETEREKHFEDYGPEPVDVEIGFDVEIPSATGNAYDKEKLTEIATKRMNQEEHKKKKMSKKRTRPSSKKRSGKNDRSNDESDNDSDESDHVSIASDPEEESSPRPIKVTKVDEDYDEIQLSNDPIIFKTSSVDQIPRFKVKVFQKRVKQVNK
jgi:hypothetical protein